MHIVTPYGCKLPVAIDTVKIALFNLSLPLIVSRRCAPLPINASLWDEYFSIDMRMEVETEILHSFMVTLHHTPTMIAVYLKLKLLQQAHRDVWVKYRNFNDRFMPLCSFTSTPTQACKSQFRRPVVAYDSLIIRDLIGDAPANAWFWSRNAETSR
jgi:hypothetical protein